MFSERRAIPIAKGGDAMKKFNSFLSPLIQAYVAYQKASEHWDEVSYESNLSLFDRYCHKQYPDATALTQEIVDNWCRKRDTEKNNSCRSRIYVVVSFIRYLRKRGKTDIREPEIPRKERRSYIPHAFTETELKNFFYACDNLLNEPLSRAPRSRRIIIPVFFRLLYSSGIRTNEARLLRMEEVDLNQGILDIRCSKGHAQHYVVLHDSMLDIMKQYDALIRKQYPNRVYFFPAEGGTFHTRKWVQRSFLRMWNKYNSTSATAYELRHHYATENINRWMDEGFGFDAKLLYLSKSMGHSKLESTRYYYSLVPGLADILKDRTGRTFDNIIPEVGYEESN
jgi:integrase